FFCGPGYVHRRDVLRPEFHLRRPWRQMGTLNRSLNGGCVTHLRTPPAPRGDPDLDGILLPLGLRTVDVQVYGLPYLHRVALLPVGDFEPRVVAVRQVFRVLNPRLRQLQGLLRDVGEQLPAEEPRQLPRRLPEVVRRVRARPGGDQRRDHRLAAQPLTVGGAKVARGGQERRLARAEVPRLGVRPGAEQLLDAFQPPRRYGQVQGGHSVLVLLVE